MWKEKRVIPIASIHDIKKIVITLFVIIQKLKEKKYIGCYPFSQKNVFLKSVLHIHIFSATS